MWKTGLTSSVTYPVPAIDVKFLRDYCYDRGKKLYYGLYIKTNTIPLGRTKATIYQKQLAYSDFLDETSFEYAWSALPSISLGHMLVPSVVLLFTSEDSGLEPVISMKVVGHHDIESMILSSDYLHPNQVQ